MLKKTITYEDLDGNMTTDTFEFHLSKAELTKLELGVNSGGVGITDRLKSIVKANQSSEIVKVMDEFITLGYGRRDGNRFVKDEEEARAFLQTEAYSAMLMEMLSDPMAMVNFLMGMLPKGMSETIDMAKMADDPEIKQEYPGQAEELRKLLAEKEEAAPSTTEDSGNIQAPPVERPQPKDPLPKRSEIRKDENPFGGPYPAP